MDPLYFTLEIFILASIIILEVYYFVKSRGEINEYENFFPITGWDESNIHFTDEADEPIVSIITVNPVDGDFRSVLSYINKYLEKSSTSPDFQIVQNIVERSIDEKESRIISSISLPLYFGLMGTFLGIILGLLKISFSNDGFTDASIQAFIMGVLIAMAGSFCGLLVTIIHRAFNYRKAQSIVESHKEEFYSFIQVELFPTVGTGINAAINKFVEGMGKFNRGFSRNIKLFDENLSDQISQLNASMQGILGVIDPLKRNTESNYDIIRELNEYNFSSLIVQNKNLLDNITSSSKRFELFFQQKETYIYDIERKQQEFLIALVEKPNELLESYKTTFNGLITDFKNQQTELINAIDLKQQTLVSSIDKTNELVNGISSIMNRIIRFEQALNDLGGRVGNADFLTKTVLIKIEKSLNNLDRNFEVINQHEQKMAQKLETHLLGEARKIDELSTRIIGQLSEALNFNPEGNPLRRLLFLEQIDKNIGSIQTKVTTLSNPENKLEEIKEAVDNLNGSIKSLNTNLKGKPQEWPEPPKPQEPPTFFNRFLNKIGLQKKVKKYARKK